MLIIAAYFEKQALGLILDIFFFYPMSNTSANTIGCASKIYLKASTGSMGMQPVQPHRAQCLKVPMLGLTFCSHCLKILNNFWTRGSCFYFALGAIYYVGPAQLQPLPVVLLLLPWSKPRARYYNSHLPGYSIVSSPYRFQSESVEHKSDPISHAFKWLLLTCKIKPRFLTLGYKVRHDPASGSFLSYRSPLVFSPLHLAWPLCFASNIWVHFHLRTIALRVPST